MSKIGLTPYEKLVKKVTDMADLKDPSTDYRKLILKLFRDQKKSGLTSEELSEIFSKLTSESFQGVNSAYLLLANLNLWYLNANKEMTPITSLYLDVVDYRDTLSETHTSPDKLVKRLFSFKELDDFCEEMEEAFKFSGLDKDKKAPGKDASTLEKTTFLLSQCYKSLSEHGTLHPKIKLCLNQVLRTK